MNVIYIIGLPGSGKSTALAKALEQLDLGEPVQELQPIAHRRHGDHLVELGRHRDTFSGTDALAMNVNPKAIAFVTELGAEDVTVVAEGDRLANRPFLEAAHKAGDLRMVLIDVPRELAEARAHARADELGKPPQAASWWKGRATKVDNLASEWASNMTTIDGTRPADEVAADLHAMLATWTAQPEHDDPEPEPGAAPEPTLWVEYRRPVELQVADANPKAHALAELTASLEAHGYTEPMIEDRRTGQLVAGHGRRATLMEAEAARAEVPAGILTDEAGQWLAPVICGWASTDARDAETYLLASNRLVELGSWNPSDRLTGDEPAPKPDRPGNVARENNYAEREERYRDVEAKRFVFDLTPDEAKRADTALRTLGAAWGTDRPETALRAVLAASGGAS